MTYTRLILLLVCLIALTSAPAQAEPTPEPVLTENGTPPVPPTLVSWWAPDGAHVLWAGVDERMCLYRERENWPTVPVPGACGSLREVVIGQGNDIQYAPRSDDTYYLAIDERYPTLTTTLPLFKVYFPAM